MTQLELLNISPERMFINQPSTLQSRHKEHGMNVLTMPPVIYPENGRQPYIRVYFTEGEVISSFIEISALDKGWN